jgi:hypothetical protein
MRSCLEERAPEKVIRTRMLFLMIILPPEAVLNDMQDPLSIMDFMAVQMVIGSFFSSDTRKPANMLYVVKSHATDLLWPYVVENLLKMHLAHRLPLRL